jgi:hypothetical protein
MKRMDRKVGVVVKITQQSDCETIQPFGPAREEKILTHDARLVGRDEGCICGKRERSGGGS